MQQRQSVIPVAIASAIAGLLCLTARAAEHRELTFMDIAPDEGTPTGPDELAWSADGTRLGFLFDDGQGRGLWLLDPRQAPPELLVRDADLKDGGPIDAFHWSPTGESLLLESNGDLFLLPVDRGRLRQLTATTADETDPKFDPDGKHLAFVRGHDLHVLDLASGRERRLTDDGEKDVTLNGETDWVYWEEIWNRDSTGFWWSPDGKRIAFYHFDVTPVSTHALVDFLARNPEVEWQKYPKAGEANSIVTIGVLDIATGRTVWMKTGREESYLTRVHWTPEGERVAIQRLNREQDRLDLLLCQPANGRCETILTEKWPTWINLGDDFAFLADGRFIWGSERSGWRQLYLYGAGGKLIRRLTPEDWSVTSLDGVDEERGWLIVTGFRIGELGAAERHVLRLPLEAGRGSEKVSRDRTDPGSGDTAGGAAGETTQRAEALKEETAGWTGNPTEMQVFTARPGWHRALMAPRTGYWVHTWSDADTPTQKTVRGPGLPRPLLLPETRGRAYDAAALPHWEFLTIDGPEGVRLPAAILEPASLAPDERRPAIMYHYGGPGSQVVADRWSNWGGLWHKMMAQRGYFILKVDNQASTFFGKHGEDREHRRFGELNLAAQLAAVEYLRSRPDVDGQRIGLWGWSGGGTHTLYCILNRPGVWRAAVSGAPVTEWHLYDSIWTERYLDDPRDNPDGYAASSPLTYAANLDDPLLLVHGTADDNVHPQNTLQMLDKLIEAEALFEDAIYPRQKHGFRGRSSRHFYRRMTAFFDRHLGRPPAGTSVSSGPAPVARE
jgi:dipeptidyl-peptidase-4